MEITNVPISKIRLNKNSRLDIKDDEIAGLMQSIKETGLLQPIGVVKAKGGGFEIVYGNRRFLAYSKLGRTSIPAVITETKSAAEDDVKNLTENIQRRNITLTEAGRYMELLRAEGLTIPEIAVRIGVTKNYVEQCINSYRDVPKEFQAELEVRVTKAKKTPGKIQMATARAIINASKTHRLTKDQTKEMFTAARRNDEFQAERAGAYAAALKSGHKNFVKAVGKVKLLNVSVYLTEEHYNDLHRKHVEGGPFSSVTALARAVLTGQKSVRFELVDKK